MRVATLLLLFAALAYVASTGLEQPVDRRQDAFPTVRDPIEHIPRVAASESALAARVNLAPGTSGISQHELDGPAGRVDLRIEMAASFVAVQDGIDFDCEVSSGLSNVQVVTLRRRPHRTEWWGFARSLEPGGTCRIRVPRFGIDVTETFPASGTLQLRVPASQISEARVFLVDAVSGDPTSDVGLRCVSTSGSSGKNLASKDTELGWVIVGAPGLVRLSTVKALRRTQHLDVELVQGFQDILFEVEPSATWELEVSLQREGRPVPRPLAFFRQATIRRSGSNDEVEPRVALFYSSSEMNLPRDGKSRPFSELVKYAPTEVHRALYSFDEGGPYTISWPGASNTQFDLQREGRGSIIVELPE